MPLADKIIELRKKQGWSQIDLADRLDVSRQSVSKWEMAQAVPELDKIIKMSELFAVTTDYLLKDGVPAPEPASRPEPSEAPAPEPPEPGPSPEPAPAPEPESPPPAAKRPRKKRPWVLAACLVLALTAALSAAGGAGDQEMPIPAESTPFPLPSPTPAPAEADGSLPQGVISPGTPSPSPATVPLEGAVAEQTVIEEPAGLSMEQTAVSDPDAADSALTVYTYEGNAATAGGIDPEAIKAIAAEYAPYGVTCEYDGDDCRWYLDGTPIRVFTDVLTSNGESLTGGDFQGVIRNFAGVGLVDVRTVRDYEHCGEDGCGTLLYLESCDLRLDVPRWVEHHGEDHHPEHHE